MNIDEALAHADRLLKEAEFQSDLSRMERLAALADSWIEIARACVERESA